MTKEEIISGIEKLQRRWQFHAVEHREKRNNNSPSYNAHEHGIAVGYLKALNTFSDWIRRLYAEKDLALTWEDIAEIDALILEANNEFAVDYSKEISREQFYIEVLNRFNKSKEEKK